jgi:hypothetical protein
VADSERDHRPLRLGRPSAFPVRSGAVMGRLARNYFVIGDDDRNLEYQNRNIICIVALLRYISRAAHGVDCVRVTRFIFIVSAKRLFEQEIF